MKRYLIWTPVTIVAILAAVLVVALCIPVSRYTLLALMRGEHFQEFMPRDYWVSQLKDPDPEVREHAAVNLGRIGPEAVEAVPALSKILKDQVLAVRIEAARAIWLIGREATAAVPALVAAIKDPEPEMRIVSLLALRRIGPGAKDHVHELIEALQVEENRDEVPLWHMSVCDMTAKVLAKIGPDAKEAVPILTASLGRADDRLSIEAADALKAIDPEAAQKAGADKYLRRPEENQ